MRNQRFHCPGPFQKWCKITSKKDSATRPPQNLKFSTSGLFLVLPAPPEGTLLEAFSAHVAIQRRPEVENWGFWGGLVAESFFEEILHYFWRGLGQWKPWFCMGGVAKITISLKSEFYYFLASFWGHFGANISLKWRLASPWAALGSHLDWFWGVRKFALNKYYGTGRDRLRQARDSRNAGWQSLSIWSAIWLDLLSLSLSIYIYIRSLYVHI